MSIALAGIDPPLRISRPEPMSLAEFWRVALENPDLRIEREPNGDVTLMSPAHGAASLYSTNVLGQLFVWAQQDGTGFALDSNAGCELPDGSVRSPDASWISSSRWKPAPITNDAPVPCPDFVIEVRSGSDRLKPVQEKMHAWIASGAKLAWLVDPVRKAVEVYRPDREPEVFEDVTKVEGEGPVGGFVLELGKVWG